MRGSLAVHRKTLQSTNIRTTERSPKRTLADYRAWREKHDVPRGAPVPGGIDLPMIFTSEADLRAAFELLDERREGVLKREPARNWLRCVGWCVPDEDLDSMLDAEASPSQRGGRNRLSQGVRTWTYVHLCEILEQHRGARENVSVDTLQAAFRRLAGNKSKIPREKLLEFTDQAVMHGRGLSREDFEDVLEIAGFSQTRTLDCDLLAQRMLERVCQPPSVIEHVELLEVPPPTR